jgi:hypothetical protein
VTAGFAKSVISGGIDQRSPDAPAVIVQLRTADGRRAPLDLPHATHIHENHGVGRMGRCAGRNRVARTLHVFGTGPPGGLGRPGSTRSDVVLETSCADNVTKHSGDIAMSAAGGRSDIGEEELTPVIGAVPARCSA